MREIKDLARVAKERLKVESAFEELLGKLVSFGVDEHEAEKLIADCIDEQYELNSIARDFSNLYQDAKEEVINNGRNYQA